MWAFPFCLPRKQHVVLPVPWNKWQGYGHRVIIGMNMHPAEVKVLPHKIPGAITHLWVTHSRIDITNLLGDFDANPTYHAPRW